MASMSGGTHRVPRLNFELTTACDHRCAHCYNVWGAPAGGAGAGERGMLPTADTIAMIEKAVRESGAEHVTLTGGEPLLRSDALEIVEATCAIAKSVQLISNAGRIDRAAAERLGRARLRGAQLTILSADRARHDRLKGARSFDRTLEAIVDLQESGVHVQVCFVAMRSNFADLGGVMELCFALGIRSLSYNRMSPAGGAIEHARRLLPSPEEVERNLETAASLGRRFGIRISTAMPIPPCLVRMSRYRWIRFGFCSTGSRTPNVVIDPLGNVRSCNLSSTVLGNIREKEWSAIHPNAYVDGFRAAVPELCRGCRYEKTCQGGCKESARATFGDRTHPDPLVYLALNPDWRIDGASEEEAAA